MPRKSNKEVEEIVEKIIEADFKETMEQSYVDYAIEVITERALPDIRDGLKPVQRKSVYTFEQLGITKDKPFKKAGRVVGECMGKYHCHGDSSIYEAMVRMSQPFVNNLPLIDGHGNWGSIDGDGAAAMRYCVTGDTLINTQKGIIPISNIFKDSALNSDNDISYVVKSLNGKNHLASKLFNSGYQKIIKITLDNGMSIKCSYNHPLLTYNETLGVGEWKIASKITKEDKIILDANTNNALFGDYDNYSEIRKMTSYEYKDKYLSYDISKILQANKKYQEKFIKSLLKRDLLILEDLETLKKIQIMLLTNFGKYSKITQSYFDDNKYYLEILGKKKINDKYFIEDIRNIDYLEDEEIVYSLRVDSSCHSFTGNGFINHNTECRLEKISNELIDGLKDKIVPFVPNFDEEEIEPTVLPARFPNLLVNGTNGIAVGLISSIPTHNLRDCTNMLIHYMKKNSKKTVDISTAELLNILKGPDFPTGGSIVNSGELIDIYKTGEGNLSIRAKLVEETINGKPCLIVTEIPYTYSGKKASLIDKISKVILSKKIDELIEIKDESSKEGLRIVLECKKGADLEKVANKLYKFTPLQDTMPVRFNGTIGKELIPFNLVDYCRYFTKFQEEIYTKECENKRSKLIRKKEIYEGLVKSIEFIDVIIDLIRHAEKVEFAKRCLMTGNTNNITFAMKKNEQVARKFNFTELQSEAILETTLRKLNNLEVEALNDTLKDTNAEIDLCNKILSTKEELYKVIINRLTRIAKEYGIDRRTELKTETIIEYKEEPKIIESNIVFDRYGYIKVFDDKTIQKVDESVFENCKLNKKTDSTDSLWCFSSTGFLYQVKLKDLAFNKPSDRGVLLEGKLGKKIEGEVLFVTNQNTEGKLLFVTKKGFIKIVDKKEFISSRMITNSTKLNSGDEIIKIFEIDKEDKMLIYTDKNYLNFDISEISELKKTSVGIVSLKIADTEIIKNALLYNSLTDETVLINNKEYKVTDLKKQKRGSKGTKI